MKLPLDPTVPSKAPIAINTQIYERFRALMASGQLRVGDKVPSLRSLSSELGVARGTVDAAYSRLIGEGFLEARGARGTYVIDAAMPGGEKALTGQAGASDAGDVPDASAPMPMPPLIHMLPQGDPGRLQMGLPALDAFPRKVWARVVARRMRAASNLVRPPSMGYMPLREAIAAYLLRSRGIACSAGQVLIVSGYAAALGLTVQALVDPGSKAWAETPGYPATVRILRSLGITPVPVPVDPQGLDVAAGLTRCADARLAVVTPSHQSPLGVSLSLPRRRALLDWAREADAWILEDDYDSEYRYSGPPLPALKSLDRDDRVVYTGTFSKVLFPGIRLAYMVVPQARIDAFENACWPGLWGECPELQQAAACDFMVDGDFARHIKRMRTLYAKRRSYLVDAWRTRSTDGVDVHLTQGGMHLLVSVPAGASDVEWAGRARAAGFAVQPLSLWTLEPPARQGLLMGFTNVATPAQAQQQVDELMAAVSGAR